MKLYCSALLFNLFYFVVLIISFLGFKTKASATDELWTMDVSIELNKKNVIIVNNKKYFIYLLFFQINKYLYFSSLKVCMVKKIFFLNLNFVVTPIL